MPRYAAVRSHIIDLPAYEPVFPIQRLAEAYHLPLEEVVKLDANENPYAPFEFIRTALAGLDNLHRYPDPEGSALRAALSDYFAVPVENIMAGAGADDLIDLIMRLFLDPEDCVLNCPPTFGMYAFDAGLYRARVVSVPRRADFSLDLEAVERAVETERPKLIFVTSPNNPDGSLLAPEHLERLLALPVVVVLDEAYIEFAPPGTSVITRVPQRDNLVVLRTFSKWAGLAGLRVGYGIFPLWMMAQLWKIKQPYNLSVAAECAGVAAIQHAEELNRIGQKIVAERERLYQALQKLPWLKVYPSQANFLLCRLTGRDAAAAKQTLARQGIYVRYFNKPGLTDCIRISIGRPEDNQRVLQALGSLGTTREEEENANRRTSPENQ